jgi:FlaA1/EpsC-like NDP-sugar epimerase
MLNFYTRYNDKFVSKWLVLLMDIFLVAVSFVVATAIRFNFDLTYLDPSLFKYHLIWVVFIKTIFFLLYRTYVGIIRHTSVEDAKTIFKAIFFSFLVLFGIGLFLENIKFSYLQIPNSILLIDFFIALFALISSRFLIKTIFESLSDSFKSKRKVVIYGSGRLGIVAKNTLNSDKKNDFNVLYFIDDNTQKVGKSIEGIKVYSKEQAKELMAKSSKNDIEIILAIQELSSVRRNDLVDEFLELGLKIKVVPPIQQWINGQLSINQIQEISIEDLLERPAIQINNRLVKEFVKGKKVLITGAAGSIGSEIVRQILVFEPAELILLDQAESPLYDLETSLIRVKGISSANTILSVEIANVTNSIRMEKIFEKYTPEVVFHAAAYKHVPMMERNPYKAVRVNTLGTALVADLASKYKAEKFVFISTDKAVNPTNVMGASKRAAEMYVHSLNRNHLNETRFIVTRFGNVLGSNGSVIPLFKKQIASGGPVTVTHPEVIRYFMTIPEACQLVLEAGTMGKGGEIFVFDMGVPVKILDLAKKMIQLSGFEPDTQIPIEFSGLRAGEKLFEELLNIDEATIPTHHPKIMIAKITADEYEDIKKQFDIFKPKIDALNNEDIVSFLKNLVPEFLSNNSPYEKLDNKKALS